MTQGIYIKGREKRDWIGKVMETRHESYKSIKWKSIEIYITKARVEETYTNIIILCSSRHQ